MAGLQLDRWLITESDPPADALLEPPVASFQRDHDVPLLHAAMLRTNRHAPAG